MHKRAEEDKTEGNEDNEESMQLYVPICATGPCTQAVYALCAVGQRLGAV
jgi:hypothetical protein